jgi:hypothetical protein
MFFVPRWISSRTPLFEPWKDLRRALSLAVVGGIFFGVVAPFGFRLFHWPLSIMTVTLVLCLIALAYSRESLIPARSRTISYHDPHFTG